MYIQESSSFFTFCWTLYTLFLVLLRAAICYCQLKTLQSISSQWQCSKTSGIEFSSIICSEVYTFTFKYHHWIHILEMICLLSSDPFSCGYAKFSRDLWLLPIQNFCCVRGEVWGWGVEEFVLDIHCDASCLWLTSKCNGSLVKTGSLCTVLWKLMCKNLLLKVVACLILWGCMTGQTGLVCRHTVLQNIMNFYRTESDTSSAMEDVDGVEPESHEIKLGKVKGLDRRTPRKNLGKYEGIGVACI